MKKILFFCTLLGTCCGTSAFAGGVVKGNTATADPVCKAALLDGRGRYVKHADSIEVESDNLIILVFEEELVYIQQNETGVGNSYFRRVKEDITQGHVPVGSILKDENEDQWVTLTTVEATNDEGDAIMCGTLRLKQYGS